MANGTDPGRLPRARKRFGQHFLEPAWVAKLVDAMDIQPDDRFIEIGPGRGALTRPLAARAGQVVAVEIDRDLAARLSTAPPPNVTVVCADVLTVDLGALVRDGALPVRVAGNLPYNVASPIVFALLDQARDGHVIADATVMLQKEVADRLAAAPGDPDYGALAIQVALRADVERLLVLPPGAFRPPPKVTSAVVRLRFRPPAFDVGDLTVFTRLVRGVFLHRRKTLINALTPVAHSLGREARDLIEAAGLDGSRRPEQLRPSDFGRLASAVL